MPALLERPKLSSAMARALHRHVMMERERKRQGEPGGGSAGRRRGERAGVAMATGPAGPVGSLRPMGAAVKWGASPWQRGLWGLWGGGGRGLRSGSRCRGNGAYRVYGGGREGSGVPCRGNGACRSYGRGGEVGSVAMATGPMGPVGGLNWSL